MHRVLRSRGGHCHLHMRTHVSLSRVWTQAQETDQRWLPYLPETHQGRDKNVQAMRGLTDSDPNKRLRNGVLL